MHVLKIKFIIVRVDIFVCFYSFDILPRSTDIFCLAFCTYCYGQSNSDYI